MRIDCGIWDCENPHTGLGLCEAHLYHHHKYGVHTQEVREYELEKAYDPKHPKQIGPAIRSFCASLPVDAELQHSLELALKRAGRRMANHE